MGMTWLQGGPQHAAGARDHAPFPCPMASQIEEGDIARTKAHRKCPAEAGPRDGATPGRWEGVSSIPAGAKPTGVESGSPRRALPPKSKTPPSGRGGAWPVAIPEDTGNAAGTATSIPRAL